MMLLIKNMGFFSNKITCIASGTLVSVPLENGMGEHIKHFLAGILSEIDSLRDRRDTSRDLAIRLFFYESVEQKT